MLGSHRAAPARPLGRPNGASTTGLSLPRLAVRHLMILVATLAVLLAFNVPTAKMVFGAAVDRATYVILCLVFLIELAICYYVMLTVCIVCDWIPRPDCRQNRDRRAAVRLLLRLLFLVGPGLAVSLLVGCSYLVMVLRGY